MTRRERIRLNRVGSNQHVSRRKWYHATYWNLLILPVVLLIGLPIRHYGLQAIAWAEEATTVKSQVGQPMLSPLPDTSDTGRVEEVTPTPTLTKEQDSKVRESGAAGLERYIRQVFGEEGDYAVAVSRRECGPTNPQYPKCVASSDVEYSVGLFQVNLYNSKGWVHAGRIPGDTMEEKIEWAQDPFHNIQFAKQIRDEWGNWNAWSVHTNGRAMEEYREIQQESN